ncbi:MAG: hypothetical protein ACOCXT_02685 [Candidatus Dojkabacteria bacterium]
MKDKYAPTNSSDSSQLSGIVALILKHKFYILIALVLIVVTALITYALTPKTQVPNTTSQPSKEKATSEDTTNATPTSSIESTATPAQGNPGKEALIKSSIPYIAADLGIYTFSDSPTEYYNAGTIQTGTYKGYKKIVAYNFESGWGSIFSIFATKDNKTFIGDTFLRHTAFDEKYLNQQVVTKYDDIETVHPLRIRINQQFELVRTDFLKSYPFSSDPGIHYNFANLKEVPDIKTDTKLLYSDSPTKESSNTFEKLFQLYHTGNEMFISVDKTGAAYVYTLATSMQAAEYQTQLTQFINGKRSEKPDNPNLRFVKSDLVTSQAVYNSYDAAFPNQCGGLQYPDTVKLNQSNLRKIGTMQGLSMYSLIKNDHDLHQLQYQEKVIGFGSESEFEQEHGFKTPSLQHYASKNPLLFTQDFLGRWIVLGESELKLKENCG